MSKHEYDLKYMKEVSGEGISKLATRSELAMARELQRHGLTMQWYSDKLAEQDGLCLECHRPERVKLANGKKRPLALGFGADGKPDRLLCQSCCSQQRKARAEQRNAPKDHDSLEGFWQANKAALEKDNPAEFARLQARHDYMSELYDAICDYVRGTDNCPEGLQDTLDEVQAELTENGTTDLDQLSVPLYRVEHRHLFDEIQQAAEVPDAPRHARNCAVYAKYGLLQALPVSAGDHVVREFLRKNSRWPFPDWSKPPNAIKTIKCSTYQCKGEFQYDERDKIPGWYFSPCINAVIPPPQWFCDSCRAKTAARKPVCIKPRPEDQLFMSGRVMSDLQNTNAAWFQKFPGE